MSLSVSEPATARIDGCLRSPLRYAVSAAAMYFGFWPEIIGTR